MKVYKAATNENYSAIRTLLQSGEDSNPINDRGYECSALDWVLRSFDGSPEQIDAIKTLVEYKANLNYRDDGSDYFRIIDIFTLLNPLNTYCFLSSTQKQPKNVTFLLNASNNSLNNIKMENSLLK